VMKLTKGEFIMRKQMPTKDDLAQTEPVEIIGVSATVDQVAKKWYLKTRTGGHPTKYRKEVDEMLSKDLYIKLHKNGNFEAEVLIVQNNSKWSFGTDNKSIIIDSEEVKKIWNILSVSDHQLVLQKGKSDEIWTFTTKLE